MKTCFGYIRVSTQKQGEGVSLDAQKDAIQAFAHGKDLTITKWFEEKQTAAKGGRPIFNQMLTQLKRGAASGVIIHKIDRSARNLRDWAMLSELPDAGISVYVATESLDYTSRGGRLTADIQAVIAADYIRNLREEIIKGLHGRLKQGLYPFKAPVGYLDQGKGKDTRTSKSASDPRHVRPVCQRSVFFEVTAGRDQSPETSKSSRTTTEPVRGGDNPQQSVLHWSDRHPEIWDIFPRRPHTDCSPVAVQAGAEHQGKPPWQDLHPS